MSDIKVNIVGEFDKRGFDAADKATGKLSKSFDRLAKRLGAALTIGAIAKFSKMAITAFAEDEKAAKALTRTYQNLGLAFEGAIVNDYVDQLQRATGVADTELRPALSTLTRATLDYGKAQSLLNTALNISAGTGYDLTTVTRALAKAQLGQMSSLAKLNVGIGKAEASTISFDDALARINARFSGQAQLAAESYEGQLKRLKIQGDEAKETLGRDLVLAINRLTNGGNLSTLGNKFQDMADNAGKMAIGIADIVGELNKSVSATGASGWITKFNDLMAKLNVFEYLKGRGQDISIGVKQRTLGAPGAMQLARQNAKLLAEEKAAQAKIIAMEKARTAEQLKQKRLKQISNMLTQKEANFDLQRIQLAAAAQGRLTAEEANRVKQLQAIEDIKAAVAADDLETAESLLKKLQDLQDEQVKLAKSLTTFPKANDPFEHWATTLTGVMGQLTQIAQKKIVVDFLANFQFAPVTFPSTSAASTAVANATSNAANAAQTAQDAELAILAADAAAAVAEAQAAAAAAIAAKEAAEAALKAAKSEAEKAAAEAALKAAEEAAKASVVLDESAAALTADAAAAAAAAAATEASQADNVATLLEADAASKAASDALLEASFAFEESVVSAYASGATPITEVTVNIAGSVISEGDLVEMITDEIYRIQKTGKRITLSSIAI